MKSSHCYWQDFEVHYRYDAGGLIDWSLYPKPDFVLTKEQEEEIEEIIHEDMESRSSASWRSAFQSGVK